MAGDKPKTSDVSTGVDIDPEEFAKEALSFDFEAEPADDRSDDEPEEPEEEAGDKADEDDPEGSDPDEKEGDDQDDDGSEDAGGDDEAGKDDEEEDGDELDPLVARARDMGLGQNFNTVDEVLEAHKSLQTRLHSRDDDAAFGRLLRERGVTPEHLEALARNKAEPDGDEEQDAKPKGWNPPVEWDPSWERTVKPKHDEEGNFAGYEGPPEDVANYQKYMGYQDNFWRTVMRDPNKLGEVLEPIIEQRVAAAEKARRDEDAKSQADQAADQAAKDFMKKHGEFIDKHEKEFFELVEAGNDPEFVIAHLELKHKEPKKEPAKGKEGKDKDLEKARKRRQRRGGSRVSPVRPRKKASDKSEDEILGDALEKLPEEERAGMGL